MCLNIYTEEKRKYTPRQNSNEFIQINIDCPFIFDIWTAMARAFDHICKCQTSHTFHDIIKEYIERICLLPNKNDLLQKFYFNNQFYSKKDILSNDKLNIDGEYILEDDQLADLCDILDCKYKNGISDKNYAELFCDVYKNNIKFENGIYRAI